MSNANSADWVYICILCGYKVTIDAAIPEQCPSCGTTGWWGHLATPGVFKGKSPRGKSSAEEVSPLDGGQINPVVSKSYGKNNRQLKQRPELVDLVNKHAREGMGAKRIAAELHQQGIEVSYRTIARLLAKDRDLK